jgi:signal transduction histidine kinase
MQTLVDGLLHLARGDEGIPLDRVETDLRELAVATFERVQAGAGEDLGWSLDVPDSPVCVSGDRDALTQAIATLLDNAAKYTPAGGHVSLTVRQTGNAAEIAVSDTGIGIDAAHLPHIFDRFYRVEEARSAGGTGLGLAIARQIAAGHGGDITVSSEPGKGSTFTLRLAAQPD